MREIQELRFRVLNKAVGDHPRQDDRGISSWKERDKLTSAFLLSMPGPVSGMNSLIFAEACATYLCLPSRVCADRVGEKVGKSRVDAHGERIVSENLPGGHWQERHNEMAQEIAALCVYAGVPVEREPYGLFGHLVPQKALSKVEQNGVSQVLRPDIRL